MPSSASRTNEEWPEIINGQAVGEVIRAKIETQPPEPKTLALKTVSNDDLKSIKKKDPFLYYSIPGVRSARLLGKEVDTANLGTCKIRSCPSSLFTKSRSVYQPSRTVTRGKRIAFEGHPDLLYEDLAIEEGNEDDDFAEEDEDVLDIMLEQVCGSGSSSRNEVAIVASDDDRNEHHQRNDKKRV